MSDNPVRVAVVIPVFNGSGFIGDCLESVRAQSVACSVIAVDDASTDDSAALIAQRFPDVALMRNPINLGFAATVNLGLQRANDADFVFVLNQDTVLDQACIARLIDAFGALPGAGVMGCKILYPDGKTVQHRGGWLRRPGAFGEHFGRGEPESAGQDTPREVEFVTGAAIMLSRAALQILGGLDTRLSTAYFEDTDLCFRARAAGLGVWYWPGAQLTHFEGSSIPKFSYQQHVYFHTGRTGFALRHWPPEDLVAFARGEQEASAGSGSLDDVLARSRAYLTHLSNLSEARRARDQIYAVAPNMRASESIWAEVTQRLLDARESALKRACEFLEIPSAGQPIELPGEAGPATEPIRRPATAAAQDAPVRPRLQLHPLPAPPAPRAVPGSEAADSALAALEPGLRLREYAFTSRVPVLGSLIAGFRHAWHSISGRWALQHLARQQSDVNQRIAGVLRGLAAGLTRLERAHAEQASAQADAIRGLADAVNRQTAELADALDAQGATQATESAALRASLAALAETSDAFGEALAKQRRDTSHTAVALTAQLNGRLNSISAQLASQQARYDALFREATRHENDLIRNIMRGRGAAE